MRTTVDLPPHVHERVKDLAERRGQSMSSTIAELTARSLAELEPGSRLRTDPLTGLLVYSPGDGRVITSQEVADLVDEDE